MIAYLTPNKSFSSIMAARSYVKRSVSRGSAKVAGHKTESSFHTNVSKSELLGVPKVDYSCESHDNTRSRDFARRGIARCSQKRITCVKTLRIFRPFSMVQTVHCAQIIEICGRDQCGKRENSFGRAQQNAYHSTTHCTTKSNK
jgi:hypothetical protein